MTILTERFIIRLENRIVIYKIIIKIKNLVYVFLYSISLQKEDNLPVTLNSSRDSKSRSRIQHIPSLPGDEPIVEQDGVPDSEVKGHHVMSSQDFRETVVSVCGVLLPKATNPDSIKVSLSMLEGCHF